MMALFEPFCQQEFDAGAPYHHVFWLSAARLPNSRMVPLPSPKWQSLTPLTPHAYNHIDLTKKICPPLLRTFTLFHRSWAGCCSLAHPLASVSCFTHRQRIARLLIYTSVISRISRLQYPALSQRPQPCHVYPAPSVTSFHLTATATKLLVKD